MSNFYTPEEIAKETGFSRQSVCFWLRQLYPDHEVNYWWRLESDEKAFLLTQIREAEKSHPTRPLCALRKTLFLDFG